MEEQSLIRYGEKIKGIPDFPPKQVCILSPAQTVTKWNVAFKNIFILPCLSVTDDQLTLSTADWY